MAVIVKVEGFNTDEILKRFKKIPDQMGKRVEEGLLAASNYLLRKSKQQVPIDTSNLKASGRVDPVKRKKGYVSAYAVHYTAAYAIFVHERLELKHRPPTKAKFLEDPAKNERGNMLRIMENRIKQMRW